MSRPSPLSKPSMKRYIEAVCPVMARLTHTYDSCILICMRTTLHIDDTLLEEASRLTGVKEKTTLVRMGLQSLLACESARRLAKLGGSEPTVRRVPRRRSR